MADSVLGQRLIEKIRELDDDQRQRVLEFIDNLTESNTSLGEWLERAEVLRAQFIAKHGKDHFVNSAELLHEAREERLNDILGGS